MSVVKRENRIFGITCPYMTCCKITRRQKKHRAETKRTGAVEHVRLLQLSAAGEVFLEGTCPLSRCPQTAKYSVPILLGARSRWVRKATAFRGRSEQDRSALVCRLLCCDFGNIPVECLQRISLDTNYQTRYNLSLFYVMENWRTRHNLSLQWEKNTSPTALSWISLTDSTIPFLFVSARYFSQFALISPCNLCISYNFKGEFCFSVCTFLQTTT